MQVYCLRGPGRLRRCKSATWRTIAPALPSFVAHPTSTWAVLTSSTTVAQLSPPFATG